MISYPIRSLYPLHSQLHVQLGVLGIQIHIQLDRKMALPGFRSYSYALCIAVTEKLMGAPLFKTNGWAQSSPYPVSPFKDYAPRLTAHAPLD